jgi:hypothetical protein
MNIKNCPTCPKCSSVTFLEKFDTEEAIYGNFRCVCGYRTKRIKLFEKWETVQDGSIMFWDKA